VKTKLYGGIETRPLRALFIVGCSLTYTKENVSSSWKNKSKFQKAQKGVG